MKRTYFLVNDTRYDNHHGCLTVVRNLHRAMAKRGWTCVGSLPVSSSPIHLRQHREALKAAHLIIVNGEGSLHHNSRNANRILAICQELQKTHPVALINAIWQDNDPARWKPLLESFVATYTRDRRSQEQLRHLGIDAGYAPDLTFYEYPQFASRPRSRFLCTDSVLNSWTENVRRFCEEDPDTDFQTMFTGEMNYVRGAKDWHKCVKYRAYPWLAKYLGVKVPTRYKSLPYAERDTHSFLEKLSSYQAVCAARYHALCFTLQQRVPCIAVASNSYKCESLLEEIGLPLDEFIIGKTDIADLKNRLADAVVRYPEHEKKIETFNRAAVDRIEEMFDRIVGRQ